MINESDYIKINKRLKRREKEQDLNNPKRKVVSEQVSQSLVKMKLSQKSFDALKVNLKNLYNKRDDLNETWRLAVPEGDDRETDAITVTVQLLHENELEIIRIENIIRNSSILTTNKNAVCPTSVDVGCAVTYEDESGQQISITLVEDIEASPNEKRYSKESHIGACMIGKRVGEKTTYTTPTGKGSTIKIIRINNVCSK